MIQVQLNGEVQLLNHIFHKIILDILKEMNQ